MEVDSCVGGDGKPGNGMRGRWRGGGVSLSVEEGERSFLLGMWRGECWMCIGGDGKPGIGE